ncbi:hypothetical protein PHYPSEUDO_013035 [Phytophthora pseudosyringae]|uniref:Elicitin-like protein n=1 Tax=Phytophthora pseudosyringae TaxID=221518 RepID=A0A8T1V5U7_9STRA|nr:hypothetical protein PHYPSEUDO_013035 [Phytophthora pseudosyringae]
MDRRIAALLVSLALLFWVGESAECSDAEAASTESIWAAAAATSACSPYVTQMDPIYVNAPCTATDCVAVVEGVAVGLPDCTFGGVNNKIEVQNALTSCNGGSTEDAGSPTMVTDAPAATGSSSQMGSNTTLASSASSSALTPVSTESSASCTTAEVKNMLDLYVSTARTDACAEDAIVDGYGVDILTECDSNCAGKIRGLADDLPNCFYDYEYMNKKEDMLNQLDICEGTGGYVSATIYPDSITEFASSTGSELDSQSDAASSSNLPRSGDDPSDTTSDSSNVGIKSNTSPPRACEEKLHLLVSLVAAVAVAFVS